MLNDRKQIHRWLAVLVCLVIIAIFSNTPGTQQDLKPFLRRHPTLIKAVQRLPHLHFTYAGRVLDNRVDLVLFLYIVLRKVAHVLVYGGLGLSLAGALAGMGRRRWVWAGLLVAGVAVLDEWHQMSVAGRDGLVQDVVLDVAGYGGLVMLYLTYRAVGQVVQRKKNNAAGPGDASQETGAEGPAEAAKS
ncbi:MAG: VanZ family protein [Firmicutes bacterium]|nr:VanZ family protein [Bacillota bacterium]